MADATPSDSMTIANNSTAMANLQQQVQQQLKYIQNQRQQLQDLRDRIGRLEQLLPFLRYRPEIQWLMENKSERMDPTVPIFDPGRADFHLDRYVFAATYCRTLRVADIACGTGYGSEHLKKVGGASRVVGVDICPEAIQYAVTQHGGEGLDFRTAPGEATGLEDASCDVVVSFETIEHVPDDRALLAEFARILAPGGRLVCSTPNLWPLAIAPHHVREYDRQQFVSVLQCHFEVLELWNQNSGTSFEFNRQQPRGIVPTTDVNHSLAECFLAICVRR
ncbi:MAG: class I SAM-dependent methyltransferase [Pirellulaceae bacterium]|nr:class I SAM-dependent methyltransferase [Pirellulaceae bacterium]